VTVTEEFVTWAWSLTHEPPPVEVRHAAARQLLDATGVMVAGARSAETAFVGAVADGFTAPAESTRIDSGAKVPSPIAALVNGASLHSLDLDDTHAGSLIHASAAVVPAALAVAEERGATGAQLLDAVTIGNELSCRLGAAVPHGFHARGFHPTSVCGVFGATLAVAWLMELDEASAVAALGIAGSMAAGSLEFLVSGSSTKQLHPGWSNHSAVMACRLAVAGGTGPATIVEGARGGLFHSYLGVEIDPASVVHGLGERWETTRLGVKRYACCHLSHASIDAARELTAAGLSDIEQLLVTIHPDAVDIVAEPAANKAVPTTPYEAKFSMPWCVAAAAIDGELPPSAFDADRIDRGDVRDLAVKVRYEVDSSASVPAAVFGGRISVIHHDGSIAAVTSPGGRGGPDDPLSDAELLDRFVVNCSSGEGASEWADWILRIADADADDLRTIIGRLSSFAAVGPDPRVTSGGVR